jgi:hypothetical protein
MSTPPDNYVGEPEYPAPWTTTVPREGLRDNDEARIVSLAPDVCKSPKVPVPYPIVDFCGHDANYTPSVRFTTQKAMVLRSHTTHVHGDEPGVGKGVKSGTVGGISEPIGHASQVRAEGSEVIRHLDRFYMNDRNTFGEAVFVRDMGVYPAPKDTDPVRGSLRLAQPTGQQPSVVLAQAAPQPGPGPAPGPRPAPPAAPRPPGTVIRPNVPQWSRPPPVSPTAGMTRLQRAARFGKRGLVLSLLFMDIRSTPTIPFPARDADEFERQLYRYATDSLDPFDANYNDRVRDWYHEELRAHHQRRDNPTPVAPQPAPVPSPQPRPVPRPDNVRVDEEERRRRRCQIGPYSEIVRTCSGEAHHIVPDMAYRLGARPTTAAAMSSTANRIPNAPTFNQGMSICLTSAQHGSGPTGLHGQLRGRLAALGASSPVAGTAPMGRILRESIASIMRVPGLPPECKALAATMTTAQVNANTGIRAPGRVRESPLPSGDALRVLSRGSY